MQDIEDNLKQSAIETIAQIKIHTNKTCSSHAHRANMTSHHTDQPIYITETEVLEYDDGSIPLSAVVKIHS